MTEKCCFLKDNGDCEIYGQKCSNFNNYCVLEAAAALLLAAKITELAVQFIKTMLSTPECKNMLSPPEKKD